MYSGLGSNMEIGERYWDWRAKKSNKANKKSKRLQLQEDIGEIRINYYPKNWDISLMSRVFGIGPGDWSSILGRVILKTKKMVLD